MLIFSVIKMLALLPESQGCYADDSCKVVPQQSFQVYTIHAEKYSIIPCIYALLTNKNELMYKLAKALDKSLLNKD